MGRQKERDERTTLTCLARSKQLGGSGRRFPMEMLVRTSHQDASGGRAFEKSPLDQIRLINFFNRFRFLPNTHSETPKTYGTAITFIQDIFQNPFVHKIQTFVIHLKHLQSTVCDLIGDLAIRLHLRIVTHPSEKAVCDARRSARPTRDLAFPFRIYFKLSSLRDLAE